MTGFMVANPLFLWFLPLAALPILFHLFYRIRKQVRPFSSLMFFLRADPRMNARKRIREWVALILRTLMLILLLLALARPVWTGAGRGGPVAAVLIIDNSGSMAAPSADMRSRLDVAVDAAAAILGRAGPADLTAAVLLVDDPSAVLPSRLASEHDALQHAIMRLEPTQASGMPARALARAASLLDQSGAPWREIHVLTDLQAAEWERLPAGQAIALPARTTLTLHRVPAAEPAAPNVSIGEVEAPHRRPIVGRTVQIRVELINRGDEPAPVRLNTRDNQDRETTQTVALAPRSARRVALDFEPQAAGLQWACIRIEDRSLESDNEAYTAFECAERSPVLLLGERASFGLLPAALSPTGEGDLSGLKLIFRPAEAFPAAATAETPLMTIMNWQSLALAPPAVSRAIEDYVRGAGSLLLVPDPAGTDPPAPIPDWLGIRPAAWRTSLAGDEVLVFDRRHRLWDDMRNPDDGSVMLRNVKAFRFRPLSLNEQAEPLLGLASGEPLLAQQAVGQGTVFAMGLPATTPASNLPLKASFLAMVQSMARLPPARSPHPPAINAGQTPPLPPDPGPTLNLQTVAGKPLAWSGSHGELPACPHSGIFTIRSSNGSLTFCVQSSAQEGTPDIVASPRVPALSGLPHRVLALNDTDALLRRLQRERSGADLLLPLMLLALLALLVEGWLVNPRARRAGTRAESLLRRRLRHAMPRLRDRMRRATP